MKTIDQQQVVKINSAFQKKDIASEKFVVGIFLDDTIASQELADQLKQFNYAPKTIRNFIELQHCVSDGSINCLIVSTQLPDGNGSFLVKQLSPHLSGIPILFITRNDHITVHLETVNAGGIAMYPMPIDTTAILDKLDYLSYRKNTDPYRVLIVDDSETIATYMALVLQNVGIETKIVIDPLKIMDPLTEFDPDLILMDLTMPQCSGFDLAKVIRQRDNFNCVPIAFLSNEDDIEKQSAMIKYGGYDFINKSINPKNLSTSIKARVRKARKLKKIIVKDSLTGLLNHSYTKQLLENEFKQASRNNSYLCFSMIDIDHFKQVNDVHGHLTGDRVIKQFARLLQQRLRKTDIVGRYGGEEFAVIMPNTTINDAKFVIEDLRISFSKILHHSTEGDFHTSFSCGISDSRACESATEINENADRLLYQAKKLGRNRVSVSIEECMQTG